MRRHIKLILLLLIYTIVIYHLVDYDNFPFSPNYQFPLNEIVIAYVSSVLGVIFMEWNYQSSFKKNKLPPKERVKKFLKTALLVCIVLIILVHVIRGKGNLYYLIISFLLTTVNLTLWITLIYGKSLFQIWTKLIGQNSLNIKSGTKIYKVGLDDLSHFSSKNKIVTAHLKSGKDITTNFNLKELEEILSNEFFRINRQFILNKEVIDIIKGAKNNTLEVQLKNQNSDITLVVSRYRVTNFRKWIA